MMTSPTELLTAIWGDGWHCLCSGTGRNESFRVDGAFDDPETLLDSAFELNGQRRSVWFEFHPMDTRPATRGSSDLVSKVLAIPADLDWFDPDAHSETELPSENEVRARLDNFTIKPSVTICSGHGLQPWWLLDAPVDADTGVNLIGRLHAALDKAGLPPDRADLASVLRIPGSMNWKKAEPIAVTIEFADLSFRYVPEYLDKHLPGTGARKSGKARGGKTGVVVRGLDVAVEQLRAADRDQDADALEVICKYHGGHDPYIDGDGHIYVTHPGKKAGTSASIGFKSPGVAYIFTKSWEPFREHGHYVVNDAGDALESADEDEEDVADEDDAEQHDAGEDAPEDDAGEEGSRVAVAFDGYRLTEAGNALRLIELTAGQLRYVHAWGRWIVYRRGRWQVDAGDALVTELAKKVAKRLLAKAATVADKSERKALFVWAIRSESSGAVSAMIRLARGDPRVLTEHEHLDADAFLLNVRNGTVDLRSGVLRPHDPDDLLTMQAPVRYDPDAKAPLWVSCVERWQPDDEIREYLQREAGAGTTGHPTETLSIHYGGGGNGKSKFFGGVQFVLGDYAVVPHKSLLVTQRHEQHETIKADLFRKRLAIASETKAVDVLDDEQVKSITGGDKMRARRMREDPWFFWPSHTMIVVTNFRPAIHGRDESIWRRVRLIPWMVTIPKADVDIELAGKLKAEAPGILLWLIDGARRFVADGLEPPESIRAATEQYRHDEDTPARFVAECLVLGTGWVMSIGLQQELDRWCRDQSLPPMVLREIVPLLLQAGCFTERRTIDGKKCTIWVRICIADDDVFSGSDQP